MFEYFRGELVELLPTSAVVEVKGVGYTFSIPLSTSDRLKRDVASGGAAGNGVRPEVRLNAHLHVREDEMRLYGFATTEERRLFRMVLSVAGVGPSIGLACLSSLRPDEVLRALAAGECKTLQRVKGVGRKVAERMIVDLKDRAAALVHELDAAVRLPGATRRGAGHLSASDQEDAVRALIELGYQRKAAESMVSGALEQLPPREPVNLEELVKTCLRR